MNKQWAFSIPTDSCTQVAGSQKRQVWCIIGSLAIRIGIVLEAHRREIHPLDLTFSCDKMHILSDLTAEYTRKGARSMQEHDNEQAVGQPGRTPINQRNYQSLIDQQIAQAEAAGQFANLPGQGRPQRLDDDLHVPEDERPGYRMLQGAGFSLPWIETKRDIDEERARIDAWLIHADNRWTHTDAAGRSKMQGEFQRKLEALRSMIIDYNLRVPPTVGQLRGIELTQELARLGAM